MAKKRISVDFDGVIHLYKTPWTNDETVSDPPVEGAFDFLEQCINSKFDVVINSTRCSTAQGKVAMWDWFKKHGFKHTEDLIFSEHKLPSILYIDDRGFMFEGIFPSQDFLRSFQPWNRKNEKKSK